MPDDEIDLSDKAFRDSMLAGIIATGFARTFQAMNRPSTPPDSVTRQIEGFVEVTIPVLGEDNQVRMETTVFHNPTITRF